MNTLPLKAHAYYIENFLNVSESVNLYNDVLSLFDPTDKRIQMADGSMHESETSAYLFTEPELTSYDAFPEVWGGRSPWTALLADVRDRIEQTTGVRFQVARCVYYADGSEGIDFHSDPPAYGSTDQIASLSLGAKRTFAFRGVDDPEERIELTLTPGSLVFMGEGCQDLYEHALLYDKSCKEPRLNITFRKYGRS